MPNYEQCRRPTTILLIVKYRSIKDMRPKQTRILAQIVDVLLKQQTSISPKTFEHITLLKDGVPASYIYMSEPVLEDLNVERDLNNYKKAFEQIFMMIKDVDFWQRNLEVCYKSGPLVSYSFFSLVSLVGKELHARFGFCESMVVNTSRGVPSEILPSPAESQIDELANILVGISKPRNDKNIVDDKTDQALILEEPSSVASAVWSVPAFVISAVHLLVM